MNDDKISLPMLANGLDSIASALTSLLGSPGPRQLKAAVLALWSGVLIVLKAPLLRKDYSLLFIHPDKATLEAFRSGNFTGPKFEKILDRLDSECGIRIDKDALTQLRRLSILRRRFEHFAVDDSEEVVITVTVGVIRWLLEFIREALEAHGIDDHADALIAEIRELLAKCELYEEQHWEEVEKGLRELGTPTYECPACHKDSLVLNEPAHCRYCGFGAQPTVTAYSYIAEVMGVNRYRTIKDGGEWPQKVCPSCGANALVEIDSVEGPIVCFACGGEWDPHHLDKCARCGEPVHRSDESTPICADCWESIMDRDD